MRTVDEELFDNLKQAIEHAAGGGEGSCVRVLSWRCISKQEADFAKALGVELVAIDKHGEELGEAKPISHVDLTGMMT